MNNSLNRYSDISFLIIDDFSEFRLSLKNMVESFGARHVDTCTNAEDALEIYAEHYHKMILVDYNLGEGLSGLQLLEELNHRNLLKADTIFVLITGETAMDLVMGALEYRPDDYLAKPFTRNSLKARLDKLMKQNQLLQPIYASLNKNKPNQALSLCDVLPLKNKRAAMPCTKIKGDILLKSGQYAKAANIYNSVIEQKELNWALMGLAKSYAGLGMLPKVKDLSERIICKNKYALAAYDLLGETYCNLGDYEQAFNLLKTAIEISPNSLIRQRQLGYLALRYLEIETAYSAFKKVLLLGRSSIKILPDDFINTLQVICMVQLGSFGALSRRAPKEYNAVYRTITKNYPNNIQLKTAVELHQLLLKYLLDKSDSNLTGIINLLQNLSSHPDKLKPFLISEIAFIEKHIENNEIKNIIEQTIGIEQSELFTQENAKKSQNYNKQGMLKFKQKDYVTAMNAFKTALLNAPSNANVALNLLQCLYKLALSDNKQHVESAILTLCAQSLENLEPSDHRYTHSQNLFNHIKAQLATQTGKVK
ncbi:response regulator [Pseudoalteromonas sp. C2R02]|uniref:response regulator n=1 Tax=Pseudoalteromonas sp. C2R02 TaxID=2841565 RepID=UPI001C0A33EE|nr:response regulator [Pseudoalteromonas sp. C2R02]MBU2967903.1 response regulator [Pseudoalteromonas sp. C2R02]